MSMQGESAASEASERLLDLEYEARAAATAAARAADRMQTAEITVRIASGLLAAGTLIFSVAILGPLPGISRDAALPGLLWATVLLALAILGRLTFDPGRAQRGASRQQTAMSDLALTIRLYRQHVAHRDPWDKILRQTDGFAQKLRTISEGGPENWVWLPRKDIRDEERAATEGRSDRP